MYNIKNIILDYFASIEHWGKYRNVVQAYNKLFFSDEHDVTYFKIDKNTEHINNSFNYRSDECNESCFMSIFSGPDFVNLKDVVDKYKKLNNNYNAKSCIYTEPLPRNYYYSIGNIKEYCQ